MNFDSLSFAIGNHGDLGPVRDVVSYLIGTVAGTAGEIWQTLTNVSVASFTAVASTLRTLVINITPVQSGSGEPSLDNVRPISGWTGASVVVSPTLDAQDGTTYAVTFPTEADTVYGGTLTDNGNGTWTLTVTQILAQLTWANGTNPQVVGTLERRTFNGAFASVVQNNGTNCPNSVGLPYSTDGLETSYYIASNGTRVQMYLPVGTSSDFIVQIVGNLATPVSYTITADSVQALIGQNNIFADTGNINTITFRTH